MPHITSSSVSPYKSTMPNDSISEEMSEYTSPFSMPPCSDTPTDCRNSSHATTISASAFQNSIAHISQAIQYKKECISNIATIHTNLDKQSDALIGIINHNQHLVNVLKNKYKELEAAKNSINDLKRTMETQSNYLSHRLVALHNINQSLSDQANQNKLSLSSTTDVILANTLYYSNTLQQFSADINKSNDKYEEAYHLYSKLQNAFNKSKRASRMRSKSIIQRVKMVDTLVKREKLIQYNTPNPKLHNKAQASKCFMTERNHKLKFNEDA